MKCITSSNPRQPDSLRRALLWIMELVSWFWFLVLLGLPFVRLFLQKLEEANVPTYIWEAITTPDLMCKMCPINHVVRVVDKLQRQHARQLFCYI